MAHKGDFKPTKKATSDDREDKIWKLRVKGWTQMEIAEELGVDQSTVCKAIKRAGEKHHERFMSDINEYKKNQAALIEQAGLSALKQYIKSFDPLIHTTKSGVFDEKEKKFKGKVNTTVQRVSQNGDSKLLQAFFKSQEEIRKIWGFDNPTKNVEGKLTVETMSMDEKIALFTSIPIEERLKLLDSMLTRNPVHDEKKAQSESESEE